MDDLFIIALHHLAQAVGLAQMPQETWTSEDRRALEEARLFLQQHKEQLSRERKRAKDSREPIGNPTEE